MDLKIKRHAIWMASIWTILIALSLGWNLLQVEKAMLESARIQARSNYTKDVVYRRWNSIHGGVYAPVTPWTQPNPYLADTPERDIQTPSGVKLTKVNPAYMTRQAFELGLAEYGLRGHITSLNPIRPENAPDAWETKALKKFEAQVPEVDALETIDGVKFLRLMRPLITEQSCLKCHARQGYRLNEIRGGISVAVPMQPFLTIGRNGKEHLTFVHIFLWLIGLIVVLLAARHLNKSHSGRCKAQLALREAYADLERQVNERTLELKSTNEALRQSSLQLKMAVRAAGIGLWDWDLSTNKVFYSREWKQQIGYEDEEITNDFNEWRSRVHPDDLARILQLVSECLENPASEYKTEFRFRHKNGSFRWIMVQGALIYSAKNEPIRMLGAHVDITARKEAEARLQSSEAHLAAAQRVARMGSWELDLAAGTGRWSDEMFRITGFDPAKGTPPLTEFVEMLHPEDRSIQADLHARMTSTGRADQMELRSNPTKGPVRYFFVKAEAVRDSQGRIRCLVGTLQDITERKLATAALEAEKNKFRALIDESPFAVALIDQDQGFRYLNPGFETVFGYTLNDISTRFDWFEKAYPDPGYRERITASWRQAETQADPGMIRKQTWKVRCKDGSDKWVQISTAFLTTGEKIITYEDVTQRRYLEERLIQSQKMEAIGTLAGGIAHDFNNILAAMIGFAELVKEDVPPAGAAADHIGEVIRAGLRARNLVRHILDFSRQSKPEKTPLALHLVVEEALSLLKSTIPSSILIQQEINPAGLVLADSSQMHQVVLNLCTNACQAMQMEAGTLGVHIKSIFLDAEEVTLYPDLTPGNYVRFSVSDTGCGMTPDIIRRIFDPYFTTKPRGEGTGLGLAVTHGIVKNHGGAITVYSEPGKGTSLHVYLPLLEFEDQAMPADLDSPIPTGSESILFVDDEPALTALGQKMLSALGYRVKTSANGKDALELIDSAPQAFDLLITDVTMPQMSGVELAQKALRIRPDLPIILCTGFSHSITELKAKAMGIREMILKPLVRREMAAVVRKVLDDKDT